MSIELALIPIAIAVAGTIATRKKQQQPAPNMLTLETRIKDPELLGAALRDLGCQGVQTGNRVNLDMEGAQIVFQPNEAGVFEAVFVGAVPPEAAQNFVLDLYDLYTQQVQQQVYQNLLARASARGMQLESETVEGDNSVVLTFLVEDA